MNRRFAALRAVDAQESAVPVFQSAGRTALPVTDARGVLVGIVTIDDVLDVAEEEATEDIQKIGGSEALDEPYLDTPLRTLVFKRARWLAVLFVSEMLTASAMGAYEGEIKRAAVLAVFVPLIISSGGNSGSQAATLIIRALAVGEVRLRDAWRVMRRELGAGAALGALLGGLGMGRIALWQALFGTYGPHWLLLMITVGVSRRGRGALGHALGGDAAPAHAAPRRRPGHVEHPLRRHARGRDRPRDLLHRRRAPALGHTALGPAPGSACAVCTALPAPRH